MKRPQAGGVVFVQRFSSNLGLFLDFHALTLEGSYASAGDGPAVFVPSRSPTDDDVAWVAARVARWAERVLERRGLADRAGVEAAVDDFAQDEPALAAVSLAAAKGTHALDGLWAKQVERLREEHSVYMLGSSRINVAGVNARNIDYLAAAVASVLRA